jgi:hypothetical protein
VTAVKRFIVTCDHKPEECEALSRELEESGVPEAIKGKEFLCSCPYGHHGGWTVVEGESATAILGSLPPLFRSHADVYEVEGMTL